MAAAEGGGDGAEDSTRAMQSTITFRSQLGGVSPSPIYNGCWDEARQRIVGCTSSDVHMWSLKKEIKRVSCKEALQVCRPPRFPIAAVSAVVQSGTPLAMCASARIRRWPRTRASRRR